MLSPHSTNGSETESLHHHHTASAASQTGSSSSTCGNVGNSSRRGGAANSANASCVIGPRCKSALSYQQQLQLVNASGTDSVLSAGNGACNELVNGRYSPHPNDMYLHHHGKLSIQPIDRYDDAVTCCLPPPSPAPNSDRFIVGLAPPTGSVNCNVGNGNSNANSNGSSCLDSPNPNVMHMHAPYGSSYECAKKQPPQQSLSSSTSTSSLSTNSSGLPGGSGNNFSHKYVANMQQCSISPNTRFRMSDRFREVPTPKSLVVDGGSSTGGVYAGAAPHAPARYVSSTHFLTQSTPLVSSDTYTYLSSTVHTPVKRYVPTPPPPSELYTDISMPPPPPAPAPATMSASGKSISAGSTSGSASGVSSHNAAQHVNTLPYRFRVKCCANGEAVPPPSSLAQQQQPLPTNTSHVPHYMEQRSLSVTDYYATSPRNRSRYGINNSSSGKCTASGKESPIIILHEQQTQMAGNAQAATKSTNNSSGASTASSCLSSDSSNASTSASPMTVGGRLNAPATQRANAACMLADYASRTPSVEYINTSAASTSNGSGVGRGFAPVSAATTTALETNSEASGINGGGSSTNGATCLHCNTVRRTTGVHQTTQTTGPISPIPLPQPANNSGQHCLSSFAQAAHEQNSTSLTPSSSESHISPLSPTATTMPPRTEQQQTESQQIAYVEQKSTQNIATQGSIADQMDVTTGACNQQQATVGSHTLTLQHCTKPTQSTSVQQQQLPLQQQQRYSRKKRVTQYLRKEIARFFGVDASTEAEDCALWQSRQRRLALRRFGAMKSESELQAELNSTYAVEAISRMNRCGNNGGIANQYYHHHHHHHTSERPDILPAQDAEDDELGGSHAGGRRHFLNVDFHEHDHVERKASVANMLMSSVSFIIHTLNKRQPRNYRQWSRSFAPAHVNNINGMDNPSDICEGLTALQEEEVFFDSPGSEQTASATGSANGNAASMQTTSGASTSSGLRTHNSTVGGVKILEHQRQIYMGERMHGWRTSAIMGTQLQSEHIAAQSAGNMPTPQQQAAFAGSANAAQKQPTLHQTVGNASLSLPANNIRGNRISAQLLDGVLENSRRPIQRTVKLFSVNDLDDRTDHRPFFTYWINTVQILVLFLSLICYGVGPIGIGVEQKTGQVLVTSLSLQTVQHTEQRNVWIGPRNNDLVHMGAKFATCMRSDVRIMDVLLKTRRQERETACCIRNDDSGCVQSSQADCSVRGLFPTKSISTWKKWSPGESGPGGRISGSVCGLDPKYCDAPASIAPYEWPDDITKWPICRKTNSFSQRFRYKDHTAEHMVCEVIGHPCCTGVYGECRITTREYCDFVNGYFHEEASLCSQISCLNNVCGMFPFFSVEVPDQFYRLFTSLCLHAGILHLAITIAFQHVFLADLERLIGPIRAAIVYIGSGLAGNLTSAVLVPYKPEVGPLASLCGVVASLVVLLILIHWKQLRKPHVALFKLILLAAFLFGIGTLPWQLNFAGLLAGIFCGIFLTIALVPFVSVSKYGRKSKINLIWTCIIFHLFIYSVMLIIFYVFPAELTSLNMGEFLSNGFNTHLGSFGSGAGGGSGSVSVGIDGGNIVGGSDVLSSTNSIAGRTDGAVGGDMANIKMAAHHTALQQQAQQYYYHHNFNDIIANAVGYGESSKIAHLLQPPTQSQAQLLAATTFYHRNYHMNHQSNINSNNKNNNNNNNNNISNKFKYVSSNNNNNSSSSSYTSYYSTNYQKYANASSNGRSSSSNCHNNKANKSNSNSNSNCNQQDVSNESEQKTQFSNSNSDSNTNNNNNSNNNHNHLSVAFGDSSGNNNNNNNNNNNRNNNSIKSNTRRYGGYQKVNNYNTNSNSSTYGMHNQGNDTLCPNDEEEEDVVYLVEADTDAAAGAAASPNIVIQQHSDNIETTTTLPNKSTTTATTTTTAVETGSTAVIEHNNNNNNTVIDLKNLMYSKSGSNSSAADNSQHSSGNSWSTQSTGQNQPATTIATRATYKHLSLGISANNTFNPFYATFKSHINSINDNFNQNDTKKKQKQNRNTTSIINTSLAAST